MSLTRYLPVPSDRMGILWNLLSVKGSIVLEYGPAGTTHYSMSLFGELGVDNENRLFTTHMGEEDVVMGDVTRLENALLELDSAYHPEVIFVVGSSIAAVIGTDIKGVCQYMQAQVQARLVAFDQGGFRGDYSVGCQTVWKLLAEQFPQYGVEKCPDTYNILGASAGSYRIRSDVWELQNLMQEAYGMRLGTSFCLDTSVEALEQAGGAAVNLVLRDEALPCVRSLEEKFGTPFVRGMPYGYAQTLSWLKAVGEVLGRTPAPGVVSRLQEKSSKAAMYKMYGRMLKKDRAQATLIGEYQSVTGLGRFLADMGIIPVNRLCLHTLKAVEAAEEGVLHPETEKARMEILKNVHKQMIFGDDISLRMCPEDNVRCKAGMPVVWGAQIATHLPLAGERGADALLELVEEYFQIVE